MANKLMDYYKDLPTWSKGVVAVGGLAVVVIVGYTVYKKIKTSLDIRKNLEESESASDDLKDLENQGIKPTLNNSQIMTIINSLKDAMNGCGTTEQRVYDNFSKLNNDADFLLLLKIWKVQYYEPCSVTNPISYTRWMFDDKIFGGNLSEWLNYDMTTTEINKINSILATKGIKHRF